MQPKITTFQTYSGLENAQINKLPLEKAGITPIVKPDKNAVIRYNKHGFPRELMIYYLSFIKKEENIRQEFTLKIWIYNALTALDVRKFHEFIPSQIKKSDSNYSRPTYLDENTDRCDRAAGHLERG